MKQSLGVALGTTLYFYSSSTPLDQGLRLGLYLAGVTLIALSLTSMLRMAIRAVTRYGRTATYVVGSKMIVRADVIDLERDQPMVIVLDEVHLDGLLALATD